MHIVVIAGTYGYYAFDFYDDDGWPHYRLLEKLPTLKPGEQAILMKEAIVKYLKKIKR